MSLKVTKPLDIYCRVSAVRGRSGDSFQSIDVQEERCRALAKARGYRIGRIFVDTDKSGGTMDRPEFNVALQRIRDGVSGGIIVARMDRFSRTLAGAIETLEEIEGAGGYLIECDGDWDTSTPMGRFGRDLVIRLAQLYREQIAVQWVSAKTQAVSKGKHISRHVPPGYERNNGRLTPHPVHSRTVAEAFMLAASGAASCDVAAFLNEHGLPSGNNPQPNWVSCRIGRLLSNRVYLGEARASENIVKKDAHEPLVDSATWNRAQRKPRASRPSAAGIYLLSGLVRCACCRYTMRGQAASRWAVATYRCTRKSTSGVCQHPSSITMSKLDEIVYRAYAEHIFTRQHEPVKRDDSAALAALADAKQRLAEVEALRGTIREAAFATSMDDALAAVESAESQLASQQRPVPMPVVEMQADVARFAESGNALDSFTPEALSLLRRAIATDVQTVWVRPPARRSKSLDIAERVRVVFRGDGEDVELPSRGKSAVFAPYTW